MNASAAGKLLVECKSGPAAVKADGTLGKLAEKW